MTASQLTAIEKAAKALAQLSDAEWSVPKIGGVLTNGRSETCLVRLRNRRTEPAR